MKKISARACMCVEKSILECALNVVVGDVQKKNQICLQKSWKRHPAIHHTWNFQFLS
jgi:hypothetical protein